MLVFGAVGAEAFDLNTIQSEKTGVRFFNSEEMSIGLGTTVAVHDLTGDGFIDLLISEERASPQGRTNAGRIYVVDGAALMVLLASR